MKIRFALISLAAAFAVFICGTFSAISAEDIKNPTLKDLQGHWQGTLRVDKAMVSSGTRTVQMSFSGTKVTYSSETVSYVAKAAINGEEINITVASGKRSDTCKLSKEANTMILNCKWDMAANPQKNVSKASSGTMRLEKDK